MVQVKRITEKPGADSLGYGGEDRSHWAIFVIFRKKLASLMLFESHFKRF